MTSESAISFHGEPGVEALQLTRHGAVITAPKDCFGELSERFSSQHCLKLRHFLSPELYQFVRVEIERCEFTTRSDGNIAVEMVPDAANLARYLLMHLSNASLLRTAIERITGCAPLRCFEGRIYRMSPGLGHYDSWHSDCAEDRQVGMSVNLGWDAYEGGVLELRDRSSQQVIAAMPNTGPGDALLFRISPRLQHRVTSLVGNYPKTAFAGWFKSQPDYLSLLRQDRDFTEPLEPPTNG